mgnify:CR=1 FL=1
MGKVDKIIKENIEAVFTPLLEKLLDLSIKSSTEIKDKLQSTIEREPDFLKRIVDKDDREFILHLEFQSQDNHEMVYRMAEYRAILQRKYRIPVRQIVLFLGPNPPTMRQTLYKEEQITGFELRNIRDLSTADTLNSVIPEEIILAVLTDYPTANAEQVIDKIIEKLQQLANNETQLHRLIEHLLILSSLRNLEMITKEKTDQMPITYDITKDGLYKEAKLEGAKATKDRMIIRALKLGSYTVEQIAELAEVEIDYVLKLQKSIEGNS